MLRESQEKPTEAELDASIKLFRGGKDRDALKIFLRLLGIGAHAQPQSEQGHKATQGNIQRIKSDGL